MTDSTPSSVAAGGGVFIAHVGWLGLFDKCGCFGLSGHGPRLVKLADPGKRKTLLAFQAGRVLEKSDDLISDRELAACLPFIITTGQSVRESDERLFDPGCADALLNDCSSRAGFHRIHIPATPLCGRWRRFRICLELEHWW